MEVEQAFLEELTELSRKYGIAIGGCGCCGSPWLTEGADKAGVYVLSDGCGLAFLTPGTREWKWHEEDVAARARR